MNTEKDAAVSEIIKSIINDFVIEVFCNGKRAGALAADYFSGSTLPEEKALLKRVLASGAMEFVSTENQADYADNRQKALYILTEREFIAKERAERVLTWFDMALGYNTQQQSGAMDLIQLAIKASEEIEMEKQRAASRRGFLLSPVDMLLDEDNTDNIVLYNENNEEVEFEQIAVVQLRQKTYAILRPVLETPGIGHDEALVFAIEDIDDEECLVLVSDDSVVDDVFKEYYLMLHEEGIDFRIQPSAPAWVAGSGVGYSTHKNPVFPYQVYEDLESQLNLDLTLADKISHPLKALMCALRMNNKYGIACEWEKAQRYCHIYDSFVIDGSKYSPFALRYKKYNEKYLKKLEKKFWS